ncbi:MAG: DUF559 domain-containing protein [Armatimonadetes bacterium]|nr:DUF559 domain-containing protein [Armatimonadota bacterium]
MVQRERRRNEKECGATPRHSRFKLRGLRRLGLLVRHQRCIDKYIADFACLSERVIIEVDGWSHSESETADAMRQAALENEGWLALRFSNQEVLRDPTAVADDVLRHLQARRHANSPPEDREG